MNSLLIKKLNQYQDNQQTFFKKFKSPSINLSQTLLIRLKNNN